MLNVNDISSVAWCHFRNLFRIRRYLTTSACVTLVHVYVTSHLDLNKLFALQMPEHHEKQAPVSPQLLSKTHFLWEKIGFCHPTIDKKYIGFLWNMDTVQNTYNYL